MKFNLPFNSLRLRFLLAIGLWVVLGCALIWLSATKLFDAHIEQQYHEELEVHVRELARLTVLTADGAPRLERPLSDPRYEVPLSGFYWQVTMDGQPTLRSQSMSKGTLDQAIAHGPKVAHAIEQGPTGPTIAYGLRRILANGKDIHFVIATDQSELDRVKGAFTREMTLWLSVLALLLLATGVIIIRFGLRPLDRLGTAIAELRNGNVEQLEGPFPAEISPLVSDLNAFIRQNSETLTRARIEAGNLAHSLRTPLAVITDEADQLAETGIAPASASLLLEQAQMMGRQIDYQLARARFSGGGKLPGASSRMPATVLPILSAMRRLHPEKNFDLRVEGCQEIILPVDPVDLTELLSILLDNAGKWSCCNAVVTLSSKAGERTEILVADDGPGMSAEQIAEACNIGSRFDPETPGSGLGLAIARDICQSIGAELVLSSHGSGMMAKIRF